jgi:hypothetical protein
MNGWLSEKRPGAYKDLRRDINRPLGISIAVVPPEPNHVAGKNMEVGENPACKFLAGTVL